MHPLTIFPLLLTYMLLAPFLLRLAVGVLQLFMGIEKHKKGDKIISIVTIAASILLIAGLYTQIATLASLLLIAFECYREKKGLAFLREKNASAILMIAILISLLFTGPGFLAFDLPL